MNSGSLRYDTIDGASTLPLASLDINRGWIEGGFGSFFLQHNIIPSVPITAKIIDIVLSMYGKLFAISPS